MVPLRSVRFPPQGTGRGQLWSEALPACLHGSPMETSPNGLRPPQPAGLLPMLASAVGPQSHLLPRLLFIQPSSGAWTHTLPFTRVRPSPSPPSPSSLLPSHPTHRTSDLAGIGHPLSIMLAGRGCCVSCGSCFPHGERTVFWAPPPQVLVVQVRTHTCWC